MRRRFLMASVITAAALAISACGTTEAAEPDPAATSAQPISITDGSGAAITLPGPATKVVGTEWNVVENLISLGVDPVGVTDVKGYNIWSSSVPLKNTPKDVGKRDEPSVDAIAALAPDLILATTDLPAAAVKQMQKVAPVLVIKSADASRQIDQMLENLDLIAEATGTQKQATLVKSRFQTKIANAKTAMQASGLKTLRVAFSDGWVESNQIGIRPYVKGSLIGDVTTEMGFTNAWTLKGDKDYGLASTDVEGLTKLKDIDYYYYLVNAGDGGDAFDAALKKNAVWKSLPFVQREQVRRLPDGIWMFGGPASMSNYIDAVMDTLGT